MRTELEADGEEEKITKDEKRFRRMSERLCQESSARSHLNFPSASEARYDH